MVYKPALIDLTQSQIKSAIGQKPIRVKANQLNTGSKVVLLHPANHANYTKAVMKGKGLTLTISPGEILSTVESDMDGTGFFGDLWKGIKSGYNWTKKNVIDTDFYQKNLKPYVRQAVDSGVNALSAYAPQATPYINMAKNKIGEATGAYGMPVMRRNRMSAKGFRMAT